MTESLAEKTCTPCRGGVQPLPRDEALRFQAQAPDWELRDDARRIERIFRFRNFSDDTSGSVSKPVRPGCGARPLRIDLRPARPVRRRNAV